MGEVVLGVIYWPSLRKKQSYSFLLIKNDGLVPPEDGDKYGNPHCTKQRELGAPSLKCDISIKSLPQGSKHLQKGG